MQSSNNGWLSVPGKEGRLQSVWRGAGGVYLSHGNWFAGVEVGSFEKTSFRLTPSHLSVWKAAGRKGGRKGGGMEGGSKGAPLQTHFHTKAWESEWVCPAWYERYSLPFSQTVFGVLSLGHPTINAWRRKVATRPERQCETISQFKIKLIKAGGFQRCSDAGAYQYRFY